jgi:hypothetical protein
LGERRPCKAEVVGSNPISSTICIASAHGNALRASGAQGGAAAGCSFEAYGDLGCAVRSPLPQLLVVAAAHRGSQLDPMTFIDN